MNLIKLNCFSDFVYVEAVAFLRYIHKTVFLGRTSQLFVLCRSSEGIWKCLKAHSNIVLQTCALTSGGITDTKHFVLYSAKKKIFFLHILYMKLFTFGYCNS